MLLRNVESQFNVSRLWVPLAHSSQECPWAAGGAFDSGGQKSWKISRIMDIYCFRVSCFHAPFEAALLKAILCWEGRGSSSARGWECSVKQCCIPHLLIHYPTQWPKQSSGGGVCSEKDKERGARHSRCLISTLWIEWRMTTVNFSECCTHIELVKQYVFLQLLLLCDVIIIIIFTF